MTRYAVHLLLFATAAALICGCRSSGSAFNPPGGHAGSGSTKHMYISESTTSGAVLVYDMPVTSSSTPVATLPLDYPDELFVDKQGRLFVPISGGTDEGIVQVYKTPLTSSSTPAFSLTVCDQDCYPEAVAEDSNGNVYVSLPYGEPVCCLAAFSAASIGSGTSVSSPSVIAPSNGTTFGYPFGLAIDSGNNLFAADTEAAGGSLLQFSTPLSATSTPTETVTGSTGYEYGVLVDSSNHIYVSNFTACGSVSVFDEPVTSSSTPAFTIAIYPGAECGTNHSVVGMAFDGSGDLWVTTFQNEVWEVPAPITASSTPQKVLSGLSSVWGIAFGP